MMHFVFTINCILRYTINVNSIVKLLHNYGYAIILYCTNDFKRLKTGR